MNLLYTFSPDDSEKKTKPEQNKTLKISVMREL